MMSKIEYKSYPIYNHPKMIERFGDDLELIKILFQDFRSNQQIMIDKFEKSLLDEDIENAKILIHGIKGVTANLSAERLKFFCISFERKIESTLKENVADLQSELEQLKKEIQLFLDETDRFIE